MKNLELNPEDYERLIASCKVEFSQNYPAHDATQFVTNMGIIMLLMGLNSAPVSTREFIEALRSCANILDILYSNNEKVN